MDLAGNQSSLANLRGSKSHQAGAILSSGLDSSLRAGGGGVSPKHQALPEPPAGLGSLPGGALSCTGLTGAASLEQTPRGALSAS